MSGDHTEQDGHADAMDFLWTEVANALVLTALAERHRKSGGHEAADRALADAENGFEELVRFLYDRKNAKYITASERTDLKHEIRLLRKKLDSVKASQGRASSQV